MSERKAERRDERGFTLIEIVIVTAILAVLAGAGIYALTTSGQITDAQVSVARGILINQLPNAVVSHHTRNNGIQAGFTFAGAGNGVALPDFPGDGSATLGVDAANNEVEITLRDYDNDVVARIIEGLGALEIVKNTPSSSQSPVTITYGL